MSSKTIRIFCRTAVTFHCGAETFSVPAGKLLLIMDAPDWIQHDPMFGWLLKDGSIEILKSAEALRKAENDPAEGANAEGKKAPRGKGKKNTPAAGTEGSDEQNPYDEPPVEDPNHEA